MEKDSTLNKLFDAHIIYTLMGGTLALWLRCDTSSLEKLFTKVSLKYICLFGMRYL